jgi:hypothetical protein
MLTLFEGFRAPRVPDVDIFRDHADPQQFYLLPSRPRIAVDARTGTPLFNFTLFSRNIEIAYAAAKEGEPVESQLGALNMTTDLSVGESETSLIRQHLVTVLTAERATPSAYNKLFRVSTTGTQPRVAYVNTWLQGSVRLDMLEGLGATFKRASSQNTHPTLRGTNPACLWATFGTEGAQLLWRALRPDDRAGAAAAAGDRPVQANITYDLEGLARVPPLRVSVTANGRLVYQELRERTRVRERVGDSTWTYPQISELTKSLVDSRAIEVTWDDFGIPAADPSADEIKKRLQETVLGVITNQIVTQFFKQFELQGLQDADLGMTFTHTLGGKPGSRLWLNEYKEEFVSNISFTLEQSQNTRFKVYPQTSLLTNLTADQLERLVRIVDVGSPEIRVLTVHVYTNADFEKDRIANITASLSYRQFDTLVNDWIETSESFVFRSPQDTFVFRTRLARDDRGRLVDFYDAKAQINYIGTSQSPPPIELKDISERALTFSYDRLGYVKVEVQAGDVDWKEIEDVFVDFVYEAAEGEPDAKGVVRLTEKALSGAWSTSKHGQSSNRYRYTVRYVFADGRETTETPRTDDRGTLVIHDALVGRLRRTFDVSLDPAIVESLILKVRYEDPPNPPDERRKVFTTTESWEYVRALRQGGAQQLRYAYDVQYKDGAAESVGWRTVTPAEELPPIRGRRYRFGIMVDGERLDWARWHSANVTLTYRDDAHQYVKIEDLRLKKEDPFKSVEVWGFSPEAREYGYQVVLVPLDGSAPREVPPGGGTARRKGVLLLHTLV